MSYPHRSAPSAVSSRGSALSLCLALGLLAGCGGGGGGTTTSSSGTQASDTSTNSSGSGSTSTSTSTTTTTTTGSTLPVATGGGATYLVGSGCALPTGATRVASPAAIAWSTLPAGSLVLVCAGTYAGITTITATGTSANPIVVTAYDSASPPVLTESIDLQGAAWVQLSHLTVRSPTYAGFIIRRGSHHLTVADSTVTGAFAGVNITDAAGTGHRILRNTISDSVVDGINAEVNADASERTLIQHNTIVRSGVHGIEVRASHYQVEYNTVSKSGQTTGGASGIHLYSGSESEDSGDDNWVRYNLSYANNDTRAYDGNGIEADRWCDDNTIAFNLVWGNDGAGIIVYDGKNNAVQNNTAWNNGVDSGAMMALRGEIVVSGTTDTSAAGNRVWNNIAYSTRSSVSALYVDTHAVAAGNTLGANLLYSAAGGPVLRWTDSASYRIATLIDTLTGTTGNVVEAPAFSNTSAPLEGGLKLTRQPSAPGVLPTGLVDLAGASPVSTDAFFGAYYTAP
jgi:parallel beta-helix repeat protein